MFDLIKSQWVAIVAVVLVGVVIFGGGNAEQGELFDETTFTNPIVFEGGVTLEDSLSVTGAVTMTNASSTGNLQVGAANAVRCLETFATNASTTRMYWSSNSSGTVVASTTKPTGC